jgi:hypothetical protein
VGSAGGGGRKGKVEELNSIEVHYTHMCENSTMKPTKIAIKGGRDNINGVNLIKVHYIHVICIEQ